MEEPRLILLVPSPVTSYDEITSPRNEVIKVILIGDRSTAMLWHEPMADYIKTDPTFPVANVGYLFGSLIENFIIGKQSDFPEFNTE